MTSKAEFQLQFVNPNNKVAFGLPYMSCQKPFMSTGTLLTKVKLFQPLDKIRIILLYIIHKNGITEDNLKKLVSHAQIPEKDECIIKNMSKMGITVFQEQKKKVPQLNKKDRSDAVKYQLSRYVPLIKDVMEVRSLAIFFSIFTVENTVLLLSG